MTTLRIRNRLLIWFIACLLLTIVFAPASLGKNDIMPVDLVKPGMKGYGLTVFSGTKVERFNVKVIEVIKSSNWDKMIIVKLSGKKLIENGGLAAGMSGSPVYINNKLIGAISYGFPNADPLLALITPIDTMLDIYRQAAKQKSNIETAGLSEIKLRSNYISKMTPVPVATPVIVTGMSQRSYELLKQTLNTNGIEVFAISGNNNNNPEEDNLSNLKPGKLKPGSAIAVAMVSGDFQVAATGTVTWVDNDHFLAFGHPFINRGAVDFLVSEAQVLHVVNSRVMSYKVGVPLQPMGRVYQDRPAGILGILRELPEMIDVAVKIRDCDRELDYTSNFQVVSLEDLYRKFIVAGTINAIDKAIARKGAGTARVYFEVETDNEDASITRENFFSATDIATACVKDIDRYLELITTNEFNEVKIKKLRIDIEIDSLQKTARLIEVTSEKTKLKPGETAVVSVTTRTHRESDFKTSFKVTIPENLAPGKMLLTFYGSSQGEEKDSEEKKHVIRKKINSFSELIKEYLDTPKNNELVLEYQPTTEEKEEQELSPVIIKVPTQYHLTGEVHIVLEVVK